MREKIIFIDFIITIFLSLLIILDLLFSFNLNEMSGLNYFDYLFLGIILYY
jgi:hypothetical protein